MDGDLVRKSLSQGLGFTKEDRDVHIQRLSFVAELLTRNGVIAIVAAVSPYREARALARRQIENFVEVYVRCPVETCIQRDVKGMYRQALEGLLPAFTGVSDPYEEPENPEITVDTSRLTREQSVELILARLVELEHLPKAHSPATLIS